MDKLDGVDFEQFNVTITNKVFSDPLRDYHIYRGFYPKENRVASILFYNDVLPSRETDLDIKITGYAYFHDKHGFTIMVNTFTGNGIKEG